MVKLERLAQWWEVLNFDKPRMVMISLTDLNKSPKKLYETLVSNKEKKNENIEKVA